MSFSRPFSRSFSSSFSRPFSDPEQGGGGVAPGDPTLIVNDRFLTSLPSEWTFERQGFQYFEDQSGALVRVESDDVPVFEHRNGLPRGLFMERVEANQQGGSEAFTGAEWDAPENASINTTTRQAPNLENDIVELVEDNTDSVHLLPAASTSLGTAANTLSIYVRETSSRRLLIDADSAMGASALYDLTPGSPSVAASSGSASNLDARVWRIGNGFVRLILTGTGTGVATRIGISIALPSHGATTPQSYLGDGSSGLDIWGYKRETRDYVTSYTETPPGAGSAGRSDMFLSRPVAGLPATDFTFLFEFMLPFDHDRDKTTSPRMVVFGNGVDENDSIEIFLSRNNQGLISEKTVSGLPSRAIAFANEPLYQEGHIYRVAVTHIDGVGGRASFNGSPINTNTSAEWRTPFTSAPSVISIGLRRATPGITADLYARELKVWNRALTDAELIAESAALI